MKNSKKIWFTVREKRPEFGEEVYIIKPNSEILSAKYRGWGGATFETINFPWRKVLYKKWCRKSDLEDLVLNDIKLHESLK